MDLLRGNIKHTYFKYLGAAFGSAMLASVYSLVDMAMVGQYQGPDGAAALAVVAPVWNIIYSLGLLTGIGGSVLSSTHRGQGKRRQANQAFTVALGFTVILAAASWLRFSGLQNTSSLHQMLPLSPPRSMPVLPVSWAELSPVRSKKPKASA